MPTYLLTLLALLPLAHVTPAHADPAPTSSAPTASVYDRCIAQVTTDAEIIRCHTTELRKLDARLQAKLRRLENGFLPLDTPGADNAENRRAVEMLRASQRAWQAYRDAECTYMGMLDEGIDNAEPAKLGCRVEMTRERIQKLHD